MSEYRKKLIDQFEDHLTSEYLQYCSRHNTQETVKGMVTYIIDRNIIPEINIKKFTILREFGMIYKQNDNHKTHAVETLADRFNLSQRTIWSILKHYSEHRASHFYSNRKLK